MIHYAWITNYIIEATSLNFAYLPVKQRLKIRSVTCDFYGAHKQINLSMYVKLPINACIDYKTASIWPS